MFLRLACLALTMLLTGCGTTRDKQATNQLLLSDAVDRAVARIDFTPLGGESVYLDTTYIRQVKGDAFVNADYIISSLRQQMVLAGCLLQENREQANYVIEARVGVLGTDGHDVNYGVPGNQGLSAAAQLVTGSVPVSLPEVSFARRTDDSAATKIAVFAYHRETRQPVWQSGLSVARSSAQAKWILGAGPFQSGSIYEGTRFAGGRLRPSPLKSTAPQTVEREDNAYRTPAVWSEELRAKLFERDAPQQPVQLATHADDVSEADSSVGAEGGDSEDDREQTTASRDTP